ncbi:MAG TPA: histidine kinase [Acidimicrobiales bacterium]|nr:histidine kinase [Acidimicrobiales bacterium]
MTDVDAAGQAAVDAAGQAETAAPPPGREPGTSLFARVRSSLLLKILAGLVLAVVGSSTLTALVETSLTRDALDTQSRRITAGNLRVLEEAYAERERTLVGDLRDLGQTLDNEGLTDRSRRVDLVNQLSGKYRNLELDVLEVVDAVGRPLDPPASAPGVELGPGATVTAPGRPKVSSRLLPTADGGWVQAVFVPIGTGADAPFLLVGGYRFGDEFAYRLRGGLGELGHVVLVAEDRIAGSTLLDPPELPPGVGRPGGRLPQSPVAERVAGEDSLVAYRLVRRGTGAQGALGVLLDDPGAPLDRDLAEARLVAGALLAGLSLLVGWLFFRALVRPLVALKDTAGRIAEGDLEASFRAAGSDEVADLARSLERMRLELRAHLDLIAEQAEALRLSSHRIVAAQDEERHRLARDLHDGIQQHLVVLRMGVGLAKDSAERAPDTAVRSLGELGSELDAVIQRLREVSQDLYPSILVDRGLAAALRSSLGRLPLAARLVCSPDPLPRLPAEIESGAYFLVSEAVSNVLKHAGAGQIAISLVLTESDLRVAVSDDGRGFATDGAGRRGGLLHMQDRARSFGGSLEIRSEPGAGTEVVATFPLRRPAPATESAQ